MSKNHLSVKYLLNDFDGELTIKQVCLFLVSKASILNFNFKTK